MKVAFALGDAGGISPELAARVLADRTVDRGDMIVLGDARVMQIGAAQAGVTLDLPQLAIGDLDGALPQGTVLVDLANCDPDTVELGRATEASGRASVQNFRAALSVADAGLAGMVFFTPFNKHAMRLAQPDYVDEIGFIDATIGAARSGREFNVLDEVWNARVTSHPTARGGGRTDHRRHL